MRILNKSNNNKRWIFLYCDNKAFTLLEVMVALAILAIALTTLFGAQSNDLSLAAEAKFATNATLLAGVKIAELKSGRLAPVDAQGDFGKDFPGYFWRMEVRDPSANLSGLPSALQGRLRRVDLAISWEKETSKYRIRYYMRSEDIP
jgi:general secretion pathway protein I